MKHFFLLLFMFSALLTGPFFQAQPAFAADESAPVVVELFTSQSCSSCPPADKYLGELAGKGHVITLSCHVTYWDHLQWKDTLSRKFCTERQYAYDDHIKGHNVFTPQIVVNGTYSSVGSRRGDVGRSMKLAQQQAALGAVGITATGDGKINVTLKNGFKPDAPADLYVFAVRAAYHQNIASGENKGRSIDYTNAAMAVVEKNGIDLVSSGADNVEFDGLEEKPDGYIVLLQDRATMKVVAAGQFFY